MRLIDRDEFGDQRLGDSLKEIFEYFYFLGLESTEHFCPDRLPCRPELAKRPFPFRRQGHRSSTGVGRMRFTFDQPAVSQKFEHRPDGAGIGRHAQGKFPLSEGFASGQGGE